MSNQEKKIITICLTVFFLAMLGWGITWFLRNYQSVPAIGGDYSEALIGEPKYINPLFSSTNDIDTDLVGLIYSGLFKYDTRQQLTPDLANSYSISSDGRVYEINLRQNVKWADGEPFTVDDVIYTFETIQNPEVGSPLLAAFQDIAIERLGDYSLRLTLKEPFAPFLNTLIVGILPQHIWSNISPAGMRLAKTNLQPIGTGPWKFSKLTKKNTNGSIESYTLEHNQLYYQDFPYLQTITFKFFTDINLAAIALKIKDVMAASFVPNDLANQVAGKNFKIYQFKLPQYTALFFNEGQNPFLKNTESRLILNLGLDKNKIVEQALQGQGQTLHSPILKGSPGYKPDIAFPTFDPEQANKLLDKNWSRIQPEEFFKAEYAIALKTKQTDIDALKNNTTTPTEEVAAGIKQIEDFISESIRNNMDPEQSFYRKNKTNDILKVTITTVDTLEYQEAARAIAKMWQALGIKTNIEVVSSNQIVKDILRDRSYEILLYGEIIGADPDPYPFWHSSQISYPGLNLALFANRTADKLLEDGRATTTISVRAANYEKFQEILAKEIPAIFLYTPNYNFIVNKDIKGITFDNIFSPADRFNELPNWYIKTKRQ